MAQRKPTVARLGAINGQGPTARTDAERIAQLEAEQSRLLVIVERLTAAVEQLAVGAPAEVEREPGRPVLRVIPGGRVS